MVGAVNRCWRCGAKVLSHHGDNDLPPVRRAPIPVEPLPSQQRPTTEDDGDVVLAVADDQPAGNDAPSDIAAEIADEVAADPRSVPPEAGPPGDGLRRVGSPFRPQATAHPLAAPATSATSFDPVRPNYHRNNAASGGAFGALILGIMSLIAGVFTVGGVVTGFIGLIMGIWGLYSKRRGTAVLGIMLCCLAIALSAFQGIVFVYEYNHGYKPWNAPEAVDEYDFQMDPDAF